MAYKKIFHAMKRNLKPFSRSKETAAAILMYHRISNDALEPNWLAVSPRNFAQHLDHINEAYHPMCLLDLVEAVQNGVIPHKAVVITFDDGYADNFTRALPLLDQAQIPATVFVTAGHINNSRGFWWDDLQWLVMAPRKLPPTLSLEIEDRSFIFDTSSPERRQDTYVFLVERMKPLPSTSRSNIMEYLQIWSGQEVQIRDEYRTMTIDELKQLAQSDMIEIGAHTITHPILPTLSPVSQEDEIFRSRICLEEILDRPVRTFAYPNGDYTEKTVKIVEKVGYSAACTTEFGCVRVDDDPFKLQRLAINDWDVETFKRNLRANFLIL